MSLEIRVDRDACRGAGACVLRAPGTFELDEEDRVRATTPADPEPEVRAAAQACPHFAIEIYRDGRRVV